MSRSQPANHQIETALQTWRVQAQTRMMSMGLILLLPAIVHTIRRAVQFPREWPAASLLVVVYLGIAWLNFSARINAQLRGWSLMVGILLAGAISMARGGLAGDGRVYLVLLPIFGALLIHARAGLILSFASILTYIVFGIMAGLGFLENWLIIPDNPITSEFWVYDGLVFFALLGASVFLLTDFSTFLLRTLAAERKATEKLREAHQMLDRTNLSLEEKVEQRTFQLAEANHRLQHLVNHDSLTGLPNRAMFYQHMDHSIIQARHHQRKLAILFVDLDNFKAINDSHGHIQGDQVLITVANRLKQNIRESDTVARLSGDEFAIIIEELTSEQDAGFVAQKLIETVSQPIFIDTARIEISASIGISLFPRDGGDSDTLVRRADAAMYRVKHTTKSDFQFHGADATHPDQARSDD